MHINFSNNPKTNQVEESEYDFVFSFNNVFFLLLLSHT